MHAYVSVLHVTNHRADCADGFRASQHVLDIRVKFLRTFYMGLSSKFFLLHEIENPWRYLDRKTNLCELRGVNSGESAPKMPPKNDQNR